MSSQIPAALGWDWNIFPNLLGNADKSPEIPEFRLGFVPTVHSVDPVVLGRNQG